METKKTGRKMKKETAMPGKPYGKNSFKALRDEIVKIVKIMEEAEEEKYFQQAKFQINSELFQRLMNVREKQLNPFYEDAKKRKEEVRIVIISSFRGGGLHMEFISKNGFTHRAIVHKSEIWPEEPVSSK